MRLSSVPLSAQVIASLGVFLLERGMVEMPVASRGRKMKQSDILIFRASLEPEIFRDIEIASTASLYRLAGAIIDAFGFDFDHAFGFYNKLTGNYYDAKMKYELFADMGDAEEGVRSVKKTPIVGLQGRTHWLRRESEGREVSACHKIGRDCAAAICGAGR
jgi:hypothetical protein